MRAFAGSRRADRKLSCYLWSSTADEPEVSSYAVSTSRPSNQDWFAERLLVLRRLVARSHPGRMPCIGRLQWEYHVNAFQATRHLEAMLASARSGQDPLGGAMADSAVGAPLDPAELVHVRPPVVSATPTPLTSSPDGFLKDVRDVLYRITNATAGGDTELTRCITVMEDGNRPLDRLTIGLLGYAHVTRARDRHDVVTGLAILERALAHGVDGMTWEVAGRARGLVGDYAGAIRCFEEALRIPVNATRLHYMLAMAHDRSELPGSMSKALGHAWQFLDEEPDRADQLRAFLLHSKVGDAVARLVADFDRTGDADVLARKLRELIR